MIILDELHDATLRLFRARMGIGSYKIDGFLAILWLSFVITFYLHSLAHFFKLHSLAHFFYLSLPDGVFTASILTIVLYAYYLYRNKKYEKEYFSRFTGITFITIVLIIIICFVATSIFFLSTHMTNACGYGKKIFGNYSIKKYI